MNEPPWHYHSDLTDVRLRQVAKILLETRHRTLELYDPVNGDGEWSLGCRIYQRSCNQIAKAAGRFPWLSVIDDTLQFVFAIGSVPIRFYRGDGESPSPHNLVCSFNELRQLSLAFKSDTPALLWRFAVETDSIGRVTKVPFIGSATDADVVCYYDVPLQDTKISLFPTTNRRGQGIPLDAPRVSRAKLDSKDDNEGQDNE